MDIKGMLNPEDDVVELREELATEVGRFTWTDPFFSSAVDIVLKVASVTCPFL